MVAKPPRPGRGYNRFRERELRRSLRAARREGFDVHLSQDGTINFVAKTDQQPENGKNPWDEVLDRDAH